MNAYLFALLGFDGGGEERSPARVLAITFTDKAASEMRRRVALRLHLAACRACPAFERQLLSLRQALGAWRHYTETGNEADSFHELFFAFRQCDHGRHEL